MTRGRLGLRLVGAFAGFALLLAPAARAEDLSKRNIQKYAVRLFLADGRVIDVAGAMTISAPSGETSDVLSARMPSGTILQASSRTEPVWDTFEVRVRSGETSLTLRGTMGFGMHEKLPDGLMLRLGETTYRWLAYPTGTGTEGAAARKKMQAAVAKLPQDLLSDLSVLATLPVTGMDSSALSVSHLYLALSELLGSEPPPLNVTSSLPLEAEVAAKLLEGK